MTYYSEPIKYLNNLPKKELEELPYLQNLINVILTENIKLIQNHYPLIDFISRELELSSTLYKEYNIPKKCYKKGRINQLSKYQYNIVCFMLLSLYDLTKDLRLLNTILKFYDSDHISSFKSYLKDVYRMSIYRLKNHY